MWFGDPLDEYICSDAGDEVVLMREDAITGLLDLNCTSFHSPGDDSGFSGEVEITAETFDPTT